MLFAADELIDKLKANWIFAAIGLGVLVALFVLFKIATGRKKPHKDIERGQRENLADYPPPPPTGARRLSVNGEPARLRLVVVSPMGKAHDPIAVDDIPELLDDVLRGLGGFVKSDKPRAKVWPTQLSVVGFAPTFHRLIESPDEGKKSSKWVKLAGPAKAGGRNILLGLVLLTDDATKTGDVHVDTTQWGDLLRVEK